MNLKGLKPMFDNGHAGMINGNYETPGKRGEGKFGTYYEGMGNRWLTNLIIRELDYADVPYYHVCPEYIDLPLRERVNRANRIYGSDKAVYLYSQHCNAGGGTGFEGFTSPGETLSDVLAVHFLEGLEKEFAPQGINMRYDLATNQIDKDARFQVLTGTHCPAFLMETLFMDRAKDYELLWSQDFQQSFACNIAGTMIAIYRGELSTPLA